jgi:hypothetical protein
MKPTHPAVSRDTRVLLTIVLISVATLWALARLRFPDRPATPNPVPPVLAQLTPRSAFDDITAAVTRLQAQLQPSIVGLDIERRSSATVSRVVHTSVSALRFRDDLAVALVRATGSTNWSDLKVVGAVEVARDRASQLAVVRLPDSSAPLLPTWPPQRLSFPRFLIAADASSVGVSLRPVFVGSLRESDMPIWSDPVWALPDSTDLAGGTFVFTIRGELAGLVVERQGRRALVPAATMLTAADRLAREDKRRPGELGVEIEPLTEELVAATGASVGVVVTRVDPQGAAALDLRVTDVVESIDGKPTPTAEHWTARIARLTDGEFLVLSVRRGGEVRDLHLTARAPFDRTDRPLGLTLRTIARIGVEVVRVEADSAAAQSGLQIGDVLTVVGDIETPTVPQALRVFATAAAEQLIVIAVTRKGTHHVLALERTW